MKVLLAISVALNLALAAWLITDRPETETPVTASAPAAPAANAAATARQDLPAGVDEAKVMRVAGIAAELDSKGGTSSRLPGEPGFKDPRGTTLFPELPGQSRDPIYNTTLPAKKE